MTATAARTALRGYASPRQAKILQRFFKTGPGEYGEGDIFLGVKVPAIRAVAKEYRELPLSQVEELVHSKYHEERLLGLIILVLQFPKASPAARRKIYQFYLTNTHYINNWDLVDLTAPNIVGAYIEDKDRSVLYKLSASKLLWDRRIAMLATFHFIRNNDLTEALRLAEGCLEEKEDLMHKASGWMLREVGKRNESALLYFLDKNAVIMPRTMLRYAIEKLPQTKRRYYMAAKKRGMTGV